MPLMWYFVFAGGALLALLLAVHVLLPQQATHEDLASGASGPEFPAIRIHSERKGPEAVVLDTSQPTIVPPPALMGATSAAPAKAAEPDTRTRDSFAELVPGEPKQAAASAPSKARPTVHAKRKLARARIHRRPAFVPREPDYGFYDSGW